MIFPNKMQFEVLNKPQDKKVCLIMNGFGAGNSYALLLAALQSEHDWNYFICTNPRAKESKVDEYLETLVLLGYRYSRQSDIFTNKTGKRIKFTVAQDMQWCAGTSGGYFLDNAHHLNVETMSLLFSRLPHSSIYLTHSLEPSELRLSFYFDSEKDDFVAHGKIPSIANLFIVDERFVTALGDEYCKLVDTVHLVSGFGAEDNHFLMESTPTFSEYLKATGLTRTSLF